MQVPILSVKECQGKMAKHNIKTSMLCAGGQGRGTSTVSVRFIKLYNRSLRFWPQPSRIFLLSFCPVCLFSILQFQGDSGGPITSLQNGSHILAGITSFGEWNNEVFDNYFAVNY